VFNIFISSTCDGFKSYREEVRELITALGFNDIAMEKWGANPKPPVNVVKEALEESDIYVGIFAWKYGSLIKNEAVSYTHYEYRIARQLQIPRLVFMTDPNGTFPVRYMANNRGLINNLRAEIKGEITVAYFNTEIDLVRLLSTSLFQLVTSSRKFQNSNREEKAILKLRQLINADFVARRNEVEYHGDESGREWFIPEIARCNVGKYYIARDSVRREVADWLLRSQCPYLFLVGPSGIGKTNFLVMEFIHHIVSENKHGQSLLLPEAVLFLPLGSYEPKESFLDNLEGFINRSARLGISSETLENLIENRCVLLILDGLDEFVRNHGEEKYSSLFESLRKHIDPQSAKVIISCRDPIYKRLKTKGLFEDQRLETIDVPSLTLAEVRDDIKNRLGTNSPGYIAVTSNQALIRFARNPLLLEMMCRISRESWKRLVKAQTMGRLYDLWFEEIIATSAKPEEMMEDEFLEDTRTKVGKIAGLMLKGRSDLIAESELENQGLPLSRLQTLTRQPFGIFIKQTSEEWSFVHDSFREFSLAKTFATELTSKNYDLLANTSSFDYVGAETYSFLHDLLPTDQEFYRHIKKALNSTKDDKTAWNNITRNCFEAIGIIGEESAEPFIETAVKILCPTKGPYDQSLEDLASLKTKYNVVRCLERLHRSAPRPYYRHVLDKAWGKDPSWDCFGANAIRGFHKREPHPGFFPPMVYNLLQYTSDNFKQKEVSHCLLTLLEKQLPKQLDMDAKYLEINCTFALIRWLHKEHISRVKELLKTTPLSSSSKGNLFHALLRFKKPGIFDGCSNLFDGMELCWVFISQTMVLTNFVFQNVTFREYDESKLEGFPSSAFVGCKRV